MRPDPVLSGGDHCFLQTDFLHGFCDQSCVVLFHPGMCQPARREGGGGRGGGKVKGLSSYRAFLGCQGARNTDNFY